MRRRVAVEVLDAGHDETDGSLRRHDHRSPWVLYLLAGLVQLKVRSLNVGAGPTSLKLLDLVTFAGDGTAVIGGQEFGDRPDLVALFLKRCPSWRVLWESGLGNSGRKTPILYDTSRLRLVWWQQVLVIASGLLWGPGAGPDRSQAKRLNKARFVVRGTGRRRLVVKVLNMHAVASAMRTPGRRDTWHKQLRRLFTTAGRTRPGVVCIATLDANLEPEAPAFRDEQRRVPGWRWDSTGPTHGRRRIDLVGHLAS